MSVPHHSEDQWTRVTTINGLAADEVRSMLQKSIRRGWLEQAILAAYELYATGPEAEDLLWSRLDVIAAEDIGFGLIEAPAIIDALGSARVRYPRSGDRWLFAAHAVRVLATATKDRTTGELGTWAMEVVDSGERMVEIDDLAVDMHTKAGIDRGRDEAHFYAEGAQVSPELAGRDTTWGDYLRQKYIPGWQPPAPAADRSAPTGG
jgi:replication-associated recombination protein RarA